MQTRSPIDQVLPATEAQRRARPDWRTIGLVVGDIASFLVFAAAGKTNHDESRTLASVAVTAFPFALGWFLVSPFVGAFRRGATTTVRRMLGRTELAWLAAYPAVLILRWAIAPDHNIPVSFAIVILITNAVFLGVWRSVFAFVERRVQRER